MALTPQTPKLAQGLLVLFTDQAPTTTEGAAKQWAKAYTDYAVFGGVTAARARQQNLARDLTKAFNPELGGGGPALFIKALQAFWQGLAVPEQAAVVVAVTPSGTVNSEQPGSATPAQQANGLAQVIAAFTLGSVKVQLTAPPNTILPLV